MSSITDINQQLLALCNSALSQKQLNTLQYQKRLKWELKELQVKDDCQYFLEIYQKGIKGLPNENNILIPYLLDICSEFDINNNPKFLYSDYPDVDSDFLPEIQQYLKNDYIPKAFGAKYVANVGSQNTVGIKSALIDSARIYGKDRNEILKITKNLSDKNEEGKPISFSEAVASSQELQKYLDINPEIKISADKMAGKIRSAGQHAAGIIIANIPLDTLVPLIAGKEGNPCTAWGEGQFSLDLSTVGLIKFDILGSESLNKTMNCLKLIQERHGIDKVCALPDGDNWSDISYLNDSKCLEMASKGDLKTVFQFDADVARNMCKRGGVTTFEDLIAYTSLNRPGCLEMGTDDEYIKRKKGAVYTIHPLLEPILNSTYGLILYQEQAVRILNIVGLIPEVNCLEIQKAISKKKIDKFIKYKEQFITNGQSVLNQSKEMVEELWNLIESMSKYSFNLAHGCSYSYVSARNLWLKCYYPLEWYAAMMSSLKSGDPKIQDYRYDAGKRGIEFNKLDINKSKVDFSIADDNSIYYALGKIKGIGEDAAKKIESLQPYNNFKDFLDRFGVTASHIKPLLALRVFKEDTPVNLYKIYDKYKNKIEENIVILTQSYNETVASYNQSINKLLPDELNDIITVQSIDTAKDIVADKVYNKLVKIKERYIKATDKYNKKREALETYEPKINEEYLNLLNNQEAAEAEYYGFVWDNPLASMGAEYCFDEFESQGIPAGPVDLKIISIEEKKGKVTFHQILAEDMYCQRRKINIWNSDYKIWSQELVAGAMIRIQLKPPDKGYPTWTMVSERFKKYIKNMNDFRIAPLGILNETPRS